MKVTIPNANNMTNTNTPIIKDQLGFTVLDLDTIPILASEAAVVIWTLASLFEHSWLEPTTPMIVYFD